VSRPLVCAAVLVLCLAAVSAAWAGGLLGGDPRGDAKGNSALDIASIGQGYQAQLVAHRLTTHRRWSRALLANGGEISFYFNTDADAALERRLDVRYVRGTLVAVMINPRGRVVGRGLVRQPSRNTVVVTFAPSLLPVGIRRYRWFAFAGYRCRHRYRVCGDTAPNGGGLITHQLRSATAQPAPIAHQGYHLAFKDEFNAINPKRWRRSMYWEAQQPSDVFTQNGILHIVSRRSEGYPNRALSSLGYPSDGGPNKVWKHGYFEARFKWPRGVGSSPAFWLISSRDALNPNHPDPPCAVSDPLCLSAELDIFENFNTNGAARFEGTIHRNTSGRWGVPDQTRGTFRNVGFDMSAAYHTYAAKWTATEVNWYLDGVEVGRAQAFDSTNQQMFMTLYEWTGVYGPRPNATTPDNLDMQVDWVRVWQR
jgi:hypothetical protein